TSSVAVGDPVIVFGRIVTRDWRTDAGEPRVAYELEALAVGHDLSRGRARFDRRRPATTTSAIEDAEFDARVAGEPSETVDARSARRGTLGDDLYEDDDVESLSDLPHAALPTDDYLAMTGTEQPAGTDGGPDGVGLAGLEEDAGQVPGAGEDAGVQSGGDGRPSGRGRRRGRDAVLT